MKPGITNVKAQALRLVTIANELLAVTPVENERKGKRECEQTLTEPAMQNDAGNSPTILDVARKHYYERRYRDQIFGSATLFGEPAWDILIDLFIAGHEKRRVSVMSACIGAAVPSSTALRWIATLEREGFLSRDEDTDDARRVFVQLTDHGEAAMEKYFSALRDSLISVKTIQ